MSDDTTATSSTTAKKSNSARLSSTLAEWTMHVIVAAAFLVGFWAIEELKNILWGKEPKLLWDTLPIQYIFDTADFAILTWFLLIGIYRTNRIYLGSQDE